jgi:hypothetical protein
MAAAGVVAIRAGVHPRPNRGRRALRRGVIRPDVGLAAVLIGTGIAAACLPPRRATALKPLDALR